ncbi:MAG: glycosyltransferase family 4 protein [Gemmatimonadota bacterium]
MTRLLHIATAWPRSAEDVITPWLVTLCHKQAAAGHDVHVLVPAYRGSGQQRQDSITIHRFRYAPSKWERLTHEEATPDRLQRQPAYALLLPPYTAAGMAAGYRLARQERFDVVHVHWAVPHGVIGWTASRAARAKLVTTFYGAEIRWTENRFPPAKPFLRWYCQRSQLIAISASTRAALAPYTRGEINIIPYGVPLPADDRGAGRRPTGDPVVLFVGRLVERKGVDRLLEALATQRDQRWRLEIVGFGPEHDRLAKLAGDLGIAGRVEFLGKVSQEDLVAAYRRAACFVLPATLDARDDTEGLGVVLLEAMTYGTPVVATRRGGITDIVQDGRTGLLVEDTVPAIADGVRRVLSDHALADRIGSAGRQHVRTAFGWETILGRLDQVYAARSKTVPIQD